MFERICAIALLSFGMYYRTLKYGFVSDDVGSMRAAPKVKNLWQRLIVQLTGGGHYDKYEAHLITLLLHTATCIFIYIGLGKSDISFLASILFCINPRNNQAAIWLSGRYSYLMPTMFLMLAFSVPFLAPLTIFLATRQATAFVAPIGFLGSHKWWIFSIVPFIWALSFKRVYGQIKTKSSFESVAGDKVLSPRKLIIGIKTFAYYTWICLIPDRLSFYHSFMQSAAGSGNEFMNKLAYKKDKVFWFGCLLLASWLAYSIHNWTPLSWGFFWFMVCIAPYLNILRVQQEIAERYVYCANVGLMYALACLIAPNPYLIVAFLTAYAIRLWYFMPAYTDDYWLSEYSTIEEPASWFNWHSRGLKLWDKGCIREAINMWVMAKILSPLEFKVLINLAMALKLISQLNKDPKLKAESDAYLAEAKKNVVPGQEAIAKKLFEDIEANRVEILV